MRFCLCLIAGLAAFAPAMLFGQAPDFLEIRDAAKDAFGAAAKSLDTIEADQKKANSKGNKGSSALSSKTPPKMSNGFDRSKNQDKAPSTMFSKMAERATRAEAEKASNPKPSVAEQEKQVLGFLGVSADVIFRGALGILGVAVVVCVGLRLKEKVKDLRTGRPSLARSRIVRR